MDTTFFKSDLAEKLTISPGDPGTFWLHANTKGLLTDYAREMCAEVFNPETLAWENPKQKPNHFWDCEVMCQVGAWELGLRNRRPPSKEKQAAKARAARPIQPARSMSACERLAALRGR